MTTSKTSSPLPSDLSDRENDGRFNHIKAWVAEQLPNQSLTFELLAGDASMRRYYRIRLNSENESTTYIVMDAPPQHEGVCHFVQMTHLLSPLMTVPNIKAQSLETGVLLLEDFGDTTFAQAVDVSQFQSPKLPSQSSMIPYYNFEHDELGIHAYYCQAIDTLLPLQQEPPMPELSLYGVEALTREMGLFREWLLPYLGIDTDAEFDLLWQRTQAQVLSHVLTQPHVNVHRDYHSRNLMVTDNQLGVIDYQDAVISAYTYDVVSLIGDAYTQWARPQLEAWCQYACQQQREAGIHTKTNAQYWQDYCWMGVQRHLKVLGIFVRLAERDNKPVYIQDLPQTLSYFLMELHELPLLAEFAQWVEAIVVPAFLGKFPHTEQQIGQYLTSAS